MTNEEDRKTKIRDGMGNFLSVGDMIVFIKDLQGSVGRVAEFHPGGVDLASVKGKTTPARLRIVFDMTITIPPGVNFVKDIFRVVNPQNEEVLTKIIEGSPTQ